VLEINTSNISISLKCDDSKKVAGDRHDTAQMLVLLAVNNNLLIDDESTAFLSLH
jgi:hypothetical protein